MINKKRISFVLSLLLAVWLMYVILKRVGFASIPAYFAGMNYFLLLLAIGLYTIDMFIRAYRWQKILEDNEVSISIMDSFFAYNLGNSLNIIVPAKIGDLARSYYLKNKYGIGFTLTLPATMMDRVFDVIGVYVVLFFCSIYVVSGMKLDKWLLELMILGIVALLSVFIVIELLHRYPNLKKQLRHPKLIRLVDSLLEVFYGSVKNKKKFLILTASSAAIWLCEGIFTIVIFHALHFEVGWAVIIFASMIATLSKVFPVTPGGIGVFEGTMILTLGLFGFTDKSMGMTSAIVHFIMNMYGIVIGLYVLAKEHLKISKIREVKVE